MVNGASSQIKRYIGKQFEKKKTKLLEVGDQVNSDLSQDQGYRNKIIIFAIKYIIFGRSDQMGSLFPCLL